MGGIGVELFFLIWDACGLKCLVSGSVCVSPCRYCMLVSLVRPVAVLNAAFCMTCSFCMFVLHEFISLLCTQCIWKVTNHEGQSVSRKFNLREQGSCAVLQSLINSYIYFWKIRRLIKSYILLKVSYFFERSYTFWQVLYFLTSLIFMSYFSCVLSVCKSCI